MPPDGRSGFRVCFFIPGSGCIGGMEDEPYTSENSAAVTAAAPIYRASVSLQREPLAFSVEAL